MMSNPLSGHTNVQSGASSATADGLRDGDVIISPSLTNPYEGLHGNGIIRLEDYAYGAGTRNSVGAGTPGHMAVAATGGVVTVSGGYVVLGGAVYSFAGGPGGTYAFTVGSTANRVGSLPTVPAGATEVLVVVYLDSGSTGAGYNHVMYQVGSLKTVATSTPHCPSTFLTTPGTGANEQHIVIGVIRFSVAGGSGTLDNNDLSVTPAPEIHDRRLFLKPTPLFLPNMTRGEIGNIAEANAVDGANRYSLDTFYASIEDGDFAASPMGAIWQSHAVDVVTSSKSNSVLYYSAFRDIGGAGANRHTHRLGPDEVVVVDTGTPTGTDITFQFDDPNIWIVTTQDARKINPTGTFPAGHTVEIYHKAGAHTLHFDSTSGGHSTSSKINVNVAINLYGKFVYDGANWHKVDLHTVS